MSLKKNIRTLMIGNVASQCVAILGFLLLSRLYSPADIGVFSAHLAFATIVGNVAAWRYDMSIIMASSNHGARFGAAVALLLAFATIVIVFLVAALFQKSHVIETAMMAFGISIINLSSFGFTRAKRYRLTVLVNITRALSFTLLGVVLYFTPLIGEQLIAASAFSLFGIALVLLLAEHRDLPWKNVVRRSKWTSAWLQKYRDLPTFAAPALLVNSSTASVPSILLLTLFSAEIAGIYALVVRIVSAPVQVISQAANTIYQREVATLRVQGQPILSLTQRFFKTTSLMSIVGFVVLLILVWIKAFEFILGHKWAGIDFYVLVMTPFVLVRFIAKAISGFVVLGYSRFVLGFTILQLTLMSVTVVGAAKLGFSGHQAVMAMAATLTVLNGLQLLASLFIVHAVDRGLAPDAHS